MSSKIKTVNHDDEDLFRKGHSTENPQLRFDVMFKWCGIPARAFKQASRKRMVTPKRKEKLWN